MALPKSGTAASPLWSTDVGDPSLVSPPVTTRLGRPGLRLGAKRHAMPLCVQVEHELSPGGIMHRILRLAQVSNGPEHDC